MVQVVKEERPQEHDAKHRAKAIDLFGILEDCLFVPRKISALSLVILQQKEEIKLKKKKEKEETWK